MITNLLRQLLHPMIMRALEMLSDPGNIIRPCLINGKMPGPFALERALFPSDEVSPNDATVNYTFAIGDFAGRREFQIQLLVKLVYAERNGSDVVLGFISDNQWGKFPKELKEKIPLEHRYVIVNYSMTKKNSGYIQMSNEVYNMIEAIA